MAGTAGWASIDGALVPLADAALPLTDPGYVFGWIVYETIDVGPSSDVSPNLARLAKSAAAAQIPFPGDAVLREEIERLRVAMGGRAWVRVDLTGGGRRLVWATPVDPERPHRGVTAATVPHFDHPLMDGSVKHRSRAPWIAAVKAKGVDEVLFVDRDGRFTEGSTCAVIAVVGGSLYTAPWDGRILESTTLTALLRRADALRIPVVRRGALAEAPFDAVYVASTTRVLSPVVALDGVALAGWDPVGRALAAQPPV